MPKKMKKDYETGMDRRQPDKLGKLKKRAKDSIRKRIEEWTEEWGIQE